MFDGVYTSVGETYDFIEDREGGLERSKFDKGFDSFGVGLAGFEDLLASTAESRQAELCSYTVKRRHEIAFHE